MAQHTNPLTGARYPDNASSTDLATYYSWAVNDLSPQTVPPFATTAARDTAYQNWVNAGNSMRDGLECTVAGMPYLYRSGAWGRMGDVGKPRIAITGSTSGIQSASLWGIGPTAGWTISTAFGGDAYLSAIQDGVQLQPGMYAVVFKANITSGVVTSGRSFLDILVNNSTVSRTPMSSSGEDTGTNSTTLFQGTAAPVKFAVFITTSAAFSINFNVNMYRVGDYS